MIWLRKQLLLWTCSGIQNKLDLTGDMIMKLTKRLIHALIVFVLLYGILGAPVSHSYAQSNSDWSVPVNVSNSGSAINPILVRDFKGTLHAIWENSIDGYKYSQSADEGSTWTPPQTVDFPFLPSDPPVGSAKTESALEAVIDVPPPVFLADPSGSIHMFWIDEESSLFYGQATPQDLANPNRWKLNTRLVRDVLNFDVKLDSRGILHATFISNVADTAFPVGIYYLHSNIGGGFWTKPAKLYETDYFRSVSLNDSFVRIAVADYQEEVQVYVTWDVRALKRVFMTKSTDSGSSWDAVQQVKGPEDTKGLTPFNLNVSSFEDDILLVWQVGELGSSKCTVYSQWSEDHGQTWSEVVAVLGGSSECPVTSTLTARSDGYMLAALTGQVNSVMVAWNGKQWSAPQAQTQLPAFTDPLTFDPVLLGCRYDLVLEDRLYVIGCEQTGGIGGDIWYLSRLLEPVERWFTPSSLWAEPEILPSNSEEPINISDFASAPDANGYIHAVWVQSAMEGEGDSSKSILYARWNGTQWSKPVTVISFSGEFPAQLSLEVDSLERLLLSWIDKGTGDLLFSWAKLEKASSVSEWAIPKVLPSASQINTSPDILTDGSGRIVSIYAVPINENRGIYIVQSTDNGITWSLPSQVFDAVSAGWEKVEQPRICLSGDGVLHASFVRGTERFGQSVGLYYSRSVDGGASWSDAQVLSEEAIQWQRVVCNTDQTVHVLWQAYDGLVFANLSLLSQDSGVTWGSPNNITGVNTSGSYVTVAADGQGVLHFIQLTRTTEERLANQEDVILRDIRWDGLNWKPETEKSFAVIGQDINYNLSAEITSTGFLGVFLLTGYANPTSETRDQIYIFSRSLGEQVTGVQSVAPLLPTPATSVDEENILPPTALPTTDVERVNASTSSNTAFLKNLVGVSLIAVIIISLLLVFRRRSVKK